MSEKRAKEQRKNISTMNSQPNMKIEIHVWQNGRIEVLGFPIHFPAAMEIMLAACHRVAGAFMENAINGKVDKNLNLERSRIIKPMGPVPVHKVN